MKCDKQANQIKAQVREDIKNSNSERRKAGDMEWVNEFSKKELNTVAEAVARSCRMIRHPFSAQWRSLYFAPAGGVSIQLVPAALRRGGVLFGKEVCTLSFLSVWRKPPSDTLLRRLLWQAERTPPSCSQAQANLGRGGPQTSAVCLESQAQLLSPQCVIHPGGLLSVA